VQHVSVQSANTHHGINFSVQMNACKVRMAVLWQGEKTMGVTKFHGENFCACNHW